MGDKSGIQWTAIPGAEGYEISRDGSAQSWRSGRGRRKTPRQLRPILNDDGYACIWIARRRRLLHVVLLETFVGPRPAGTEGRHLDDDKTNNALANLAWGTRLENMADRQRNGGYTRGESHVAAKLTERDVNEIRRRSKNESARALAAEFHVSHTAIIRATNGRSWGHIG